MNANLNSNNNNSSADPTSKLPFLLDGEQVVQMSNATHQKRFGSIGGKFYLTDRRILFVPGFLHVASQIRQYPLSEVLGAEPGWGLFLGHIPLLPTAIVVYLRDGTMLRLVLLDRQRWCDAITWQIAHQPRPELRTTIRIRCAKCQRTIKAKARPETRTGRCPACGNPVRIPAQSPVPPSVPLEAVGSQQSTIHTRPAAPQDTGTLESYDNGFLYPLYFPFTKPSWFQNLWWVCLLMFVPMVNVLLLRGWRLELTSRVATGEPNLFPSPSAIPKYLLKGIVLWFFTLTFTVLPMVLIASLGIGGVVDTLGDIWTFILIVLGQSDETLVSFLINEGIEEVLCFLIALTWGVVSSPLYRAGMIRHSVTGKMRSFWNLAASARLIIRYRWDFLRLYTLSVFTWFVVLFLASLLASTGIGFLIVVGVLPLVYFWSTGFEYGSIGAKILEETRNAREVEPAHRTVASTTSNRQGGAYQSVLTQHRNGFDQKIRV